jgi:Leucine-rich repeat (LRR) protein
MPSWISLLKGLVVLDLRNNALQRLPGSSLAPLQLLRVIKLSNNRLEYLPVELAHLPALEELHLWRNPLGQIRNLKAPILGTSLDDFHTSPLKDSRLMLYLRGLEESCVKNAVYNRAKGAHTI